MINKKYLPKNAKDGLYEKVGNKTMGKDNSPTIEEGMEYINSSKRHK